MANRPVFVSIPQYPYLLASDTDFTWISGQSKAQITKCAQSLHAAFTNLHPEKKVLEVSGYSWTDLGKALSAFSLMYDLNGRKYPVECLFQGSKVFEKAGPFTDLYEATPRAAKKDERKNESGPLKEFLFSGDVYPNNPKDYFYNWIYSRALYNNEVLLDELRKKGYDAFTDIAFNTNKKPNPLFNCQAKALAIFIGLDKAGRLDEAMSSKDKYLDIVYNGK